MLHIKFQGYRSFGPGEHEFQILNHIWAWRQFWLYYFFRSGHLKIPSCYKLLDLFGVQLVVSFAPVFQWYCLHPWVLRVSQYVSVEFSSLTHRRSWFIDGFAKIFMRSKRFESLQKLRARVWISKPRLSPHAYSSNLLLTVPRRYFCCGSSEKRVMSVCIRSLARW